MSTAVETHVTLHNGTTMPSVGYGTFKTPDEDARQAVLAAIEAGYRHIDTAAFYFNEEGVGQGIVDSGVAREDLFITTKMWNNDRNDAKMRDAFNASLDKLGLDYLDLYLIHWPANYLQFGERAHEINIAAWKGFEELYAEGRVKAIGVSNFMPHHLRALMDTSDIVPMVNQVEFHPGWNQAGVVRFCQDNNIVVQGWSPLGRQSVLEHEVVAGIAAEVGRTAAQVCVRWNLQHGVVPLPKSGTPSRIIENIDVFDFELNQDQMEQLDGLSNIGGLCLRPDDVTF